MTLLVALASLLAAFALSRTISGSVKTLQRHALALGRGETESPVIASGPAELKDLADTFNLMAEKVQSREMALRESEERFRALYEEAPIPYQSLDEDGRILMVNQAWLDTLGYSGEEVIGRWFGEFLTFYCQGDFQERFPCFKGQGELQGVEFEMIRKDGRTILTSFNGRIGRVVVNQDITDRKRDEEKLKTTMKKLQESNQALQEFASIASHDMQEPLRKVKAFGSRLSDKCGSSLGDEGKDYLQRMLNAAERMQSLLDALLRYSRVSTKAEPFREVNLKYLAQEVLSDLEARIEETGGQVEIGDLPNIQADASQMRQLMQNLIGNGLKYHGEEKPLVRVYGKTLDNSCQIHVEDNGIGYDEKHLDKIFQPFHRLHRRSSPYEGTGMGLAICKKIVERHGGSITARSTPGSGSEFIVTLPLKQRADSFVKQY